MSYRDRKTGRFVSAATWKRSKAHGGTRYKRKIVKPVKRKERERGAPPRLPQRVDYLITLKFSEGKRSYRRDLVVPAARFTSTRDLLRQAKDELPKGAQSLARFLKPENTEIAMGPATNRKRTELR